MSCFIIRAVRPLFKKPFTVLVGALLGLMSLALPSVVPFCQASVERAHPCCQNQNCGPQLSEESCCESNHSTSQGQSMVPSQAKFDFSKLLPSLTAPRIDLDIPKILAKNTWDITRDFHRPSRFLLFNSLLC